MLMRRVIPFIVVLLACGPGACRGDASSADYRGLPPATGLQRRYIPSQYSSAASALRDLQDDAIAYRTGPNELVPTIITIGLNRPRGW
jgi:hypothetical protein